ncbi:MAG: acyl-protein synthetase [Polyangiaceae bacterium]|nr:acyl-protein synthetase [Polyangiaceae bacterium]MCW5789275.1 acyl-protein synthetase [Polyangiaceae bacterium]
MSPVVAESEALHERVRRFARASLEQPPEAGEFEALALAIARFQAEHIPGYQRLVEARGVLLERYESLVGVPTEVFRLTRVAVHPASLDVARFETSGTTSGVSGEHALRTLATYDELAVAYGWRALTVFQDSARPIGPKVVVALAPPPSSTPGSSLGHMMQLFMRCWDGRALSLTPHGAAFDGASPARWLASPAGVDVEGLKRAARLALERQEPLLLLATSFALVALLEALAGAQIPAPRRTVVMFTGGFKGRSREVTRGELTQGVARVFRIPEEQVVGEYGMTELSSQLYEGSLPGSGLSGPPGVYLEPPWLRVVPVDPATLKPTPRGEVGIAKIVDLANVDSAVAVLTQDLVRRDESGGVQLLGRRRGSRSRGCSLSFESLLAPGRPA